jgi:hypothetical protein
MVVRKREKDLTPDEIIYNNIGLIKSLFLPAKGHFFVLGKDYIITSSRYIAPYKPSTEINEELKSSSGKIVPLFYDIVIELQLADVNLNPDIGDFGRLGCKAKRTSITNDFNEIFGQMVGYKPDEKLPISESVLQTGITSNRGFGPTQVEWEKRNKYVNPADRDTQSKSMSSMDKKIAKMDKLQKEYEKIPKGWLKESKELDEKYDIFKKKMEAYKKTYDQLTLAAQKDSFSADQLAKLTEKIKEDIRQWQNNNVDALFDKFKTNGDIPELDIKNSGLYKETQDAIDKKYVAPFIVELVKKGKDTDFLNNELKGLKTNYNKLKSESNNKNYDLPKMYKDIEQKEADLLRIQTDYEILKKKYGEEGKDLIEKWKSQRNTMEGKIAEINNDKKTKERAETNKSIQDELNEIKKDIIEVNKKIKLKQLWAGDETNISEKDIKAFNESVKREDQPIEELDTLKTEVKNLMNELLKTAEKAGDNNKTKFQELIYLYNDKLKFFSDLSTASDSEVSSLEQKLKVYQDKIDSSRKIQIALTGRGTTNNIISEAETNKQADIEKEAAPIREKIKKEKKERDNYKKIKEAIKLKIKNLREVKDDQKSTHNFKDDLDKLYKNDFVNKEEQPVVQPVLQRVNSKGGRKIKHTRTRKLRTRTRKLRILKKRLRTLKKKLRTRKFRRL